MTANHAHTPSSDHLGKLIWDTIHNDVYETDLSYSGANNLVDKIMSSEWHAAEIAAAEQRGAEAALTDFRRFATRVMPPTVTRKDVITDIEVALKRLSQDRYLLMGPLRADQMEGDDETH